VSGISGAACQDYEDMDLCTSAGDYGTGWVDDWGTFNDFQVGLYPIVTSQYSSATIYQFY
jgi:hypothetical protein